MKFKLLIITLFFSYLGFAQTNKKITSIETVKILNDNTKEAVYYFQNNWKQLRLRALDNGYIESFQLLETSFSDTTPFHFVLVTTYANKKQFDDREVHFQELIEASGNLKLLNDKKLSEFRKSVFAVDGAKHIE